MAFALGVGWPTSNRSHFTAADQWATGSASDEGPGGCAAMEGGGVLALQLAPAQAGQWEIERLRRELAPLPPGQRCQGLSRPTGTSRPASQLRPWAV